MSFLLLFFYKNVRCRHPPTYLSHPLSSCHGPYTEHYTGLVVGLTPAASGACVYVRRRLCVCAHTFFPIVLNFGQVDVCISVRFYLCSPHFVSELWGSDTRDHTTRTVCWSGCLVLMLPYVAAIPIPHAYTKKIRYSMLCSAIFFFYFIFFLLLYGSMCNGWSTKKPGIVLSVLCIMTETVPRQRPNRIRLFDRICSMRVRMYLCILMLVLGSRYIGVYDRRHLCVCKCYTIQSYASRWTPHSWFLYRHYHPVYSTELWAESRSEWKCQMCGVYVCAIYGLTLNSSTFMRGGPFSLASCVRAVAHIHFLPNGKRCDVCVYSPCLCCVPGGKT